MKGGPFALSLPWPDLALGGFRDVPKKWTDQCEQIWNRAGLENGPDRACVSIGVEQKGSELNSFSVY